MDHLLGNRYSRRRFWTVAGLTAAGAGAAATGIWATRHAQAQVQTGTWYTIQSRHSGLNLDIEGARTTDGARLLQYTPGNGQNQQFRFVDSGGGYFRIQARHSNKVLDVFERSTSNGAEIGQWTDGNGTHQQWQVQQSGEFSVFVNRNSGKALDVWEWSSAPGARISQYDRTGANNQQWRLTPVGGGGNPGQSGLVGWATQNGGTTGGQGGSETTVSSASAFASAVSGDSRKIVRVSGTISISGMVRVGSNTTIIGNSGATFANGGLTLRSASNVIIQNMRFRDYADDGINIEESSRNIWVDHNTFEPGYDGACDIKRQSDFITVSWNRFNSCDKTALLGHDDGHTADRGRLRVTYHHNYFNNTNQRTPRVRFGNPVHVYNNYYRNVRSYCIATTQEAGVINEGNYFENCNRTVDLGQGSSPAGNIVSRNNHVVNSPNPASRGSVGSVPYSFTMDTPSQVASIVSGGAGAR
jgi:pectate lyase